jgi:hypothetical protein
MNVTLAVVYIKAVSIHPPPVLNIGHPTQGSGRTLCSRLECSPRQRAVPEGFVGRSEGCPTAPIVLPLQVRAVHRICKTKRPVQQAS